MLRRVFLVALLGLFTSITPSPSRLPAGAERAIEQIAAVELRESVTALASDAFAGRGVGHKGNQQAELYVADALRRAHVSPAGPDYFQAVEIYQPALGPDGRLTIGAAGQAPLADLAVGSNFYPLPPSGDRTATGRLIFAGHGISAPRWKHDDYAGLDASGAIVLVLDDAPQSLRRKPSLSTGDQIELAALDRKIDDARAHGAAGLIVVREFPGDARAIWPERPSVRTASYRLYAPMRAAPLAVAAISAVAAGPVRSALDGRQALTATLAPAVVARPIVIDNVIGMSEGATTPGEMVVVGAHLDHDGVDESGRIYNGADDNASGTAAVLAIASAFARAAEAGVRPARTVIFALWNGEEKGSLGATHYVESPLPARRMVAYINLDMVGRNETADVVHVLGHTYSPDLAKLAWGANESLRLRIKEDSDEDGQGLLRRSDSWPFLKRGVPAVFLTTGLHADYHTPEDDTERLDFAKLERIAELACRVAWMAAVGEAPRMKIR